MGFAQFGTLPRHYTLLYIYAYSKSYHTSISMDSLIYFFIAIKLMIALVQLCICMDAST